METLPQDTIKNTSKVDLRRVYRVVKPEFTEDDLNLNGPLTYEHTGKYLELFYNIILGHDGIELPDHLRPIVLGLGDLNIPQLMVIISPGAGKSLLMDEIFPLWEMGLDSSTTVLGVSAAEGLMRQFLGTSMSIIEGHKTYKEIYPRTVPDKEMGWSIANGMYLRRPESGLASASYSVYGAGCYDERTEVLTRTGWKFWKDVTLDDEFATRQLDTKLFEWQKASELISYPYNGNLIRCLDNGLDLLLTPDHNMLVRGRNKSTCKEHLIPLNECPRDWLIPTTSIWMGKEIQEKKFGDTSELIVQMKERNELIKNLYSNGNISQRQLGKQFNLTCGQVHKILHNKSTYENPQLKGYDIIMSGDEYCAFMGMYLSEGHYSPTSVHITQYAVFADGTESLKWPIFYDSLKSIFKRPICYTPSNNQFHITSINLKKHVELFGKYAPEKFIPDEIMEATPRQLQIFWDNYSLGDGSKTKHGQNKDHIHETLHTSSKKMADQLQEIAQKLGFCANIRSRPQVDRIIKGRVVKANPNILSYDVNLLSSESRGFNTSEQYYSGNVYCATVPNHTLYVRRNGKAIWCGNSKKLIGKHAKLLIADDIHDEVNSSGNDSIDGLEDWFYRTWIGRGDPTGYRMIMIGRRWAENDLYGRQKKSDDWLVMELAAIRDETTELYYDVHIPAGLSCIFNDYKAKKESEDIKIVYGEDVRGFYWSFKDDDPPQAPGRSKYREATIERRNKPAIFETVYQSKPEKAGYTIFRKDDFMYYPAPDNLANGRAYPDVMERLEGCELLLQAWDTAFTAENSSDPSCCYSAGLYPCRRNHRKHSDDLEETPFHYDIFIFDELHKRIDFGDLTDEAQQFYNKWTPWKVIIEKSALGYPLIKDLIKYNIPIEGVTVQHTSKKSRAINGAKAGSAQGWFRQGRIFFPFTPDDKNENAIAWVKALEGELIQFTGARKEVDDRVDALVHLINFAIDLGVEARDLPEGWRTPDQIDQKIRQFSERPDPYQALQILMTRNMNPFDGYCGRCKQYDENKQWCNLHKQRVSSLHSCASYTPIVINEQLIVRLI